MILRLTCVSKYDNICIKECRRYAYHSGEFYEHIMDNIICICRDNGQNIKHYMMIKGVKNE